MKNSNDTSLFSIDVTSYNFLLLEQILLFIVHIFLLVMNSARMQIQGYHPWIAL